MTKRSLISTTMFTALAMSLASPAAAQKQPASKWVTAWSTSQQGLSNNTISNATVRMIARVTIPGDAVRIRLDNTFGTAPLKVGSAYVGVRNQAAQLVTGSNRQAMFSGSTSVTIPAMGSVESDPVPLKVMAWQDLAVSLFVPDSDVKPSQHGAADVTSYVSANGSGDVAADETRTQFMPPAAGGRGGAAPAPPGPAGTTVTSTYWLKGIDVQTSANAGAIVAFGDSITDGNCSTLDAHDRWEDWFAIRLTLAGADKAVLNEGINGNTLEREAVTLRPVGGPTAQERFDRDVLSHAGVTHMILFEGTNDIIGGASAQQVIAALQDVITRAKAKGIKVIAATVVPRQVAADGRGGGVGWTDNMTQAREQVNEWIRTKAKLDGVLDFDKVVRDPANPNVLLPAFNCGDGTHPTPRGYMEMGKSVPLSLFEGGKHPAQSASTKTKEIAKALGKSAAAEP